jgi:UDP-N-acetyl-D-mannosaminuronate dehydrogenase
MDLAGKIETRSARVGVVGLGYVGLPLLRAFFNAGFEVIGFDVDGSKIEALRRGENYLKHLGGDLVREMAASGRFEATADVSRWVRTWSRTCLSCSAAPTTWRRRCARGSWSCSNRRRIRGPRAT